MKVFVEGIVLIADGVPDSTGESMDIEGLETDYGKEIPVHDGNNLRLPFGRATLHKSGNSIRADMLLEVKGLGLTSKQFKEVSKHLYPAICGKVLERDSKDNNKIVRYTVESVMLSISPNCDKRIKPIGKK